MQVQATIRDAGLRLDCWLDTQLPDLSRSRIQALIKAGRVTVDAHTAKAHQKVTPGMVAVINVPPPAPTELVAEAIPLDILYEDDAIAVINKQPGLVVHPAAGHAHGTLVNALLYHCQDLAGIGGELRPGIVHRLDKDTSGAMVVAKTDAAMANLVDQFKQGEVLKFYVALVHGVPRPPSGTIATRIGRSNADRKKMSATPARGREAVTHYEVVDAFTATALVRVRIETGRTHQIRVHFSHKGHPVVGDQTYGHRRSQPGAPRQMLHAETLGFRHPVRGEPVSFHAPIPADMAALVASLRATEAGSG